MRKKLLHGIDIAAPGGIKKLMDFHRLTFGDAVMEVNSGANTAPAGENTVTESVFKAPESQADLDRIIQDRVARAKAQFADYDDLKAKASSLDEIEEARKSELQKANERAEAAEKAVAERDEADAKRKADETAKRELDEVRADVATAKGIDSSVLRGNTREELESHAESIKSLIGNSSVVSKSGTGGDAAAVSSLDAGRDLYNSKRKKSS